MNTTAYFDTLYQQEDPFEYRTRWYEARKRALTLASLPRDHYLRGWELGCSNGVLTAALAPRCAQLLATDLSEQAVTAARLTASLDPQGVLVACHWRPDFAQARCSAEFVHAQLDALLPRAFSWSDADMLLQGWSRDTRSVAAHEGLR